MKKVLIMCESNPEVDPRPNRMIHCLRDLCEVTVVALEELRMDRVQSIAAPAGTIREHMKRTIRKGLWLVGVLFAHLRLRRLAYVLWSEIQAPVTAPANRFTSSAQLKASLRERDFDIIISHDLSLLPLAFSAAKKAKVLLDAREFYPRHFEDRPLWRLLSQPANEYLCAEYLPRCDKIITVSEGIAREYAEVYKVQPEVILSLPPFHDLSPTPTRSDEVKIVHHGIVTVSRRIEVMIEMMDYVDGRFSLDLMLMPARSSYWNRLVAMARVRKNVRLIPPVAMHDLVRFTNSYDIGLFLCKPTTFNLRFALPNKLFEFIQARLAVAIGPSVEMKKIVHKYDCGIVSHDFEPRSLAQALNRLTAEKIKYYKEQSHKAAFELSAQANLPRIRAMVSELIGA